MLIKHLDFFVEPVHEPSYNMPISISSVSTMSRSEGSTAGIVKNLIAIILEARSHFHLLRGMKERHRNKVSNAVYASNWVLIPTAVTMAIMFAPFCRLHFRSFPPSRNGDIKPV